MRRIRRGCAISILAVLASSTSIGGSTGPGQAGAPRPALVPIEFRALRNGVPVFDLKPQEVVVRVDNVERELLALDLVYPAAGGAIAPPPFATNTAVRRGREFVFAIDE